MTDAQMLALGLAKGLRPTANNISRVASQCSVESAQWAFGQWALRDRAKAKFRCACDMLFDVDGLEMATSEGLAAYHASRFPRDEPVVDLGSGIGADLIALARRGPATGFEMDPQRAEYARHNLAVHHLAAEVVIADGLAAEWDSQFAFCDPARRHAGRRTLRIEEFSPAPDMVAQRFRYLKLGGMKLSPMLPDKDLESFGGSLEFVSFGGECREAIVWLGSEAPSTSRSATHVESRNSIPAAGDPVRQETPAAFLFEADPAAIRAHCLGSLCGMFQLHSLGDSNGYLTGDCPVDSPWLKSYEVLASHSADIKRTSAEIKRLGGGTPVVKSRGAQVDVEGLRKQLRGDGDPLVLVVYSVDRSLKHVICRAAPLPVRPRP